MAHQRDLEAVLNELDKGNLPSSKDANQDIRHAWLIAASLNGGMASANHMRKHLTELSDGYVHNVGAVTAGLIARGAMYKVGTDKSGNTRSGNANRDIPLYRVDIIKLANVIDDADKQSGGSKHSRRQQRARLRENTRASEREEVIANLRRRVAQLEKENLQLRAKVRR